MTESNHVNVIKSKNGVILIKQFDSDGKILKEMYQNGTPESFDEIDEIYDGQWENGEKHGQGILRKFNKDVEVVEEYVGNWKNDKKHGQGIFKKFNEDVEVVEKYDGEWKNDKKHGQGIFKKFNEDVEVVEKYDGEWKNDKKHGQGIFKKFNEYGMVVEAYKGEWENDMKDGKGTLEIFRAETNILEKYDGHWIKDKKYGHGLLRIFDKKNGEIIDYLGNWKNDEKNGKGFMKIKRKKYVSMFEGRWEDDKKNGHGHLEITENGVLTTELRGSWTDDKPPSPSPSVTPKPAHLKSVSRTIQLSGTCVAHALSRSITRTFRLLTMIDETDVDDMFIALYCYFLKWRKNQLSSQEKENDAVCEGATPLQFVGFVNDLKKDITPLLNCKYDDVLCPFTLGGCLINSATRGDYILKNFQADFKKKFNFMMKFAQLKPFLSFKHVEYNLRLNTNGHPNPVIKNALQKRIQPLFFIQCHGENEPGHAMVLRKWTETEFCFKNTWGDQMMNPCVSTRNLYTLCQNLYTNLSIFQLSNSFPDYIHFYFLDFDLDDIKKYDEKLHSEIDLIINSLHPTTSSGGGFQRTKYHRMPLPFDKRSRTRTYQRRNKSRRLKKKYKIHIKFDKRQTRKIHT